ncbi:MAG TPA: aminotransferase class I/II-fold pyridoxal phosphate-dependent enzyme [Chthoniobacterales bacterium]|nr:aminotransferase class I/II-fold pyridoxal phosphate-dependent enzyme [Chthoniobacterales bacterium]
MTHTTFTRRQFAHLLGAGAAAAFVRPNRSLARQNPEIALKSAVVRLSANENPYGPSPKALKAMTDTFGSTCRYPDDHADKLVDAVARLHGVGSGEVLLGDGSGEILKLCADAFTGPELGKLVVADPTFEAILSHAIVNGAEVEKVPLTSGYAHDVARMGAATKRGLVYICNPNNPTASITPKNDLRDFISTAPPDVTILVDEAYFHFADSGDYESVIPLVKNHPNLIVARTFSKIYGMAGLRCGYCVAQKETIEKLRRHQSWDSVNCMALVAAVASLDDSNQVSNGKRLNLEARNFVTGELEKLGHSSIPSQANFIMFDCKRPVVPLIEGMKQKNVHVGRLFPALPNHMRLTIGKKSEMDTFLSAFKQVMA